MCRFSELTGFQAFRHEVILEETYDCRLPLSKSTCTGIAFDPLIAMQLAVYRSSVLIVDFAVVVLATVACSLAVSLEMAFLCGLLWSSVGLSIRAQIDW